jgi:hypothetical protein
MNTMQKEEQIIVIPVTGIGCLMGCEMLTIQYCIDNRSTVGGEVASLTIRPTFAPSEIYCYKFLVETE